MEQLNTASGTPHQLQPSVELDEVPYERDVWGASGRMRRSLRSKSATLEVLYARPFAEPLPATCRRRWGR